MSPKNLIILLVLILAGLWVYSQLPQPLPEAGPFPAPVQLELKTPKELKAPKGYSIQGTDEYYLQGLVVSVHHYRMGREADLSPVDFAMVWGPLTKRKNLDAIEYSQNNRWYFYRYDRNKMDVTPRRYHPE